jgi:two-component system, NarL family, sensor kinase
MVVARRNMEKSCDKTAAPGVNGAELRREGEQGNRYREDLRALAGKLLTIQDEERRRISRDLHDDVNQRLGAIGLQLDSLSCNLPDSQAGVRRQIRTIRRHVSKLSDDVRQLAYQFHQTTVEDLGLVVALQRYLNDFVKRTGLKARFTKPRQAVPIPLRLATCLYRIAQESLGNVGLHAKASHVSVELAASSKGIALIVSDDGIGMDFEEVGRRKAGLGMLSMQERVRLLNGSVDWNTNPGAGTEVTAHLPWPTESP